MTKLLTSLMLALLCSACSVLPKPTPSSTEHDLGEPFLLGKNASPIALASIKVTGASQVSTFAMIYRDAAHPTERRAYLQHRWANTPASLLEAALNRLMSPSGQGTCSLSLNLTEFIVQTKAASGSENNIAGKAIISGQFRLYAAPNKLLAQNSFDLEESIDVMSPEANALAMRRAVEVLGALSTNWLKNKGETSCAQEPSPTK